MVVNGIILDTTEGKKSIGLINPIDLAAADVLIGLKGGSVKIESIELIESIEKEPDPSREVVESVEGNYNENNN